MTVTLTIIGLVMIGFIVGFDIYLMTRKSKEEATTWSELLRVGFWYTTAVPWSLAVWIGHWFPLTDKLPFEHSPFVMIAVSFFWIVICDSIMALGARYRPISYVIVIASVMGGLLTGASLWPLLHTY